MLSEKFRSLVVFNALVELLSLFPGRLDIGLAFRLKVLELLVEVLLVVLALFNYFVEMVFLIFGGFL